MFTPSGRVYIARSFAFDETTFPYQSLFALTPTVPHLKSFGAPSFVIPSLPSSTTSASSTIAIPSCPLFLLLALSSRDVPLISVPFMSSVSLNVSSSSSSSHCHSAQELIQSHQNNPPIAILSQSIHHMQTRSKSGVFKPKLYTASIHSEPVSVSLALTDPKAMEEEYNALVRNNTWDLVPYTDASHIVQCKWVFRTKLKSNGSLDKYKARLVAKGFQTFSPVIKASTIRIVLTIAVSRGWDIQQIDINNAFLNGILQEEVFMFQLEGFFYSTRPQHVCKLRKPLYGLKQAPRTWFEKLKGALLSWGFQNSVSDSSLFYSRKNDNLLLLLVYVDDILITGDCQADIQVTNWL